MSAFGVCGTLLLAWGTLATPSPAGETSPAATGEFVNRVFQDEHGDHKYVVFVPRGYNNEKTWPVIVWLHGASARGKDGRAPLVSGIGPNIARRKETFPFLVVFPQCEYLESRLLGGWTDEQKDADRALQILAAVERDYRVDPRRRTLAGVSMGAFGVWAVGARSAALWSAMIPVSGGGSPTIAEPLRPVPVWAFHAADDQVVPPSDSQKLIDAIHAVGGRGYYTQLPNGGHNIGSRVFAKEEIYDWLMNPAQPPRQPTEWPLDTTADLQLQNEVAFVPGAEVANAVRVHLGADVLEALAHSLPGQLPAEALNGSRGPQAETKTSGWMRFQVVVPGVQYSGQLRAATLQLLPENQIRIRLGLQPLTMTVLGTEVQGRWLRAHAGAMQIVIGSQQPAWLDIVVRPRVEARRLKLDLVSADFPIAPGNWYVTEPAGVMVRPLPFLRNRISRQITDGIYAKQGEISQQILAGVPRMLELIEQRAATQLDRVVTFGRWPMPVWQPRAKFWLSKVDINPDGLDIQLGSTLAALAPQTEMVEITQHPGPDSSPAPSSQGIQFAVAKDMVTVWTELLARSEVRRFHAQDFHSQEFHRLADPGFLQQVMPGWRRQSPASQLRSVLSFEQPMDIHEVEAPRVTDSAQVSTMRLAGRELRLTVSERMSTAADWAPIAEFPLAWSQDFRITLQKVNHRSRTIQISSTAPPEVRSSGRYFDAETATNELHHQLVAEQFRRGWEQTFATALAKEIRLPDRVIAGVPLTCDGVAVQGDYFVLQMIKPATQIRNVSREPLTYEIQIPGSRWSEPHSLPPGMMHEFQTPATITWRTRTSDGEHHSTLPIGSVARYLGGSHPALIFQADVPPLPFADTPGLLFR